MPKASRERFFVLILLLLPILLLALLESGLRISGFAETRRHAFKPIEGKPGWIGLNPEYPSRYFRGFLPAVAFTPFRSEKPENGIRIVVLGGSSTAGFPYQWYQSFPAALERRLTDQYAGRPVEVINLGMTAVNSYTLWDLTRHVLAMEPDLVIVYAGHNEFYGAYGAGTTASWYPKAAWFGRTLLTLKRSAIVLALERILLGPPDYGLDPGSNERTLMARVVQDAGIVYGGKTYIDGLDQFRSNMNRVLARYESKGIPVLAGTLISNLSEQHPLSRTPDAVEAFESAQAALNQGDSTAAHNLFKQARDLDQIRFRASSDVNQIISSWGLKPGVSVVDLEPVFNRASRTGIPGYELFTDHLHPNDEGYDLMAEAFAPYVIERLDAAGQTTTPLNLNWAESMIDGLSEAEAGILIDRLLSDYPFNLDAVPQSATSAYEKQLVQRRDSGLVSDSLAIAVMVSPLSTQNALLEGARIHESRGDSAEALRYYHSLFYWQPFNAALMEEVIGRYLSSSSWDSELSKMALFGTNRSELAYFWNALAVTQIRQERWEGAAVALTEAEKIAPSSPVMLYNRARLELAQGDSAAARRSLEAYRRAAASSLQ